MASVNELYDLAIAGQPAATDDVFVFPASFAQQRLWFLDKLDPGQGYNVPFAIRLTGKLRPQLLERAIGELKSRHEVLRTTFSEDESGRPVQLVSTNHRFLLATYDLRCEREESRENEARRLVIEQARLPFDLKRGPLFRADLVRIADADYVLSFAFHHSIIDGASIGILLRELSAIYEAFDKGRPSPLAALPIQYGDYATWQQESLQGTRLEKLLGYWTNALQGAPPVLDLPTDFARPPEQTFSGAHESLMLPQSVEHGLVELSKKEGATLFMTLLAAFSMLLARYSGQEDIVVGSPISGRTRSELEGLLGFFVNTLPLRTDLSGNPSFRTLLRRVRETALQAYAHQDLPFEKLVEELNPERNLSHNPIMQVMFTFDSVAPRPKAQMSNVTVAAFRGAEGMTTKFDLSLNALLNAEGLTVGFTYNVDLFEPATAKRMLAHLCALLEGVVAAPDKPIAELNLLSEAEREQQLIAFNATEQAYPREMCVHQLFELQVERTPEAIAVAYGTTQLSYAELNRRANQLARFLLKQGVKPGTLVGVCLDRSVDMLVAVLGVLKAGAAYAPLDPAYPKDRIAFVIQDSEAQVLITQSALRSILPETSARLVFIDEDWNSISAEDTTNLAAGAVSDSPAYVIYTSGSTGKPKGVEIPHRSVVNFLTSMQREPGFKTEDVLLAVTTLSFDIAGLELYLPLSVGGKVVIASREEAGDGALLMQLLQDCKATVMQATPATWRLLLDSGWQDESRLKVLCGGEALPLELAERLLPRCGELWNMYGPTETTIWSSVYHVRDLKWTSAPIGMPIANTQMYVLDKHSRLVPIGVSGELHIGGDGLARGYWNRPELTSQKFIADPFSHTPGARLYKTGDLVRYLPDGNLQYLSRIDNQVKLRGFRIELGEIESVLNEHEAVQQSVVIVREDTPGNQQLVAYVVADRKGSDLAPQLRAFLSQRVPNYMVPSAFVVLDVFPLTPNGKLDRRALRAPDFTDNGPVVAPRNVLEEKLLAIWKQVLQNPAIGVTDNFFDLGGHSLMAARLVSEMEKALGRKVPLAALFRGATVEEMATVLHEGSESAADPMVMRIQAGSTAPFFAIVAPGMDAIGYAALAQAMGPKQTFYKLQSHRAVKPDAPITLDDMRAIAREYTDAVRSVQPKGPYYFGGMCAGTHISEQMVLQLEAEGEKVALFAIFDTWVRQNSHVRWKWLVYYYWQRVRGMRSLSLREQMKMIRGALAKKLLRVATLPGPVETSWSKLYWPGKDFQTPHFKAPIALFKRPRQPFYYMKDEAMGWGERSQGGVHIYRIDFPHRMLRDPYVRELASYLLECLSWTAPGPVARLQAWPVVGEPSSSPIDVDA